MAEWNNLFIATTGSAAGLTGLLFVGISINIHKIISIPTLTRRALLALIVLLMILVISIIFLVPRLSAEVTGFIILPVILIGSVIIIRMDNLVYKEIGVRYKKGYKYYIVVNCITIFCYLMCSTLLISSGEKGMYWIVPAILLSFVKAILDAWVLLVEILR